ncbi:uncharacterized protein LOC118436982 [Folsomia candida]|uniref:ER-bound oxygenase mpaB/mpaB'/Rubber oxygenase catalytic domain-containing protein n=1 Tax=Folsomia candida TaxID=158441 RepID=A0A226DSK8_FOLCA|nr:uncharacterized protein LOC118436982 [Folsomia candida]OXA48475.1 hypothetical protein Fcan01_16612 [Folsomia candida]
MDSSVHHLISGLYLDMKTWRGGNGTELYPPWMNPHVVSRGQQFALENVTGVVLSAFYGLTMLFAFPQISDILIFTENSDTRPRAGRRYAATMLQVFLWMRRGFQMYPAWTLKSLSNVHLIHGRVAENVAAALAQGTFRHRVESIVQNRKINSGLWAAFQTDLDQSGIPQIMRIIPKELQRGNHIRVPMNQFVHAMTQWAFFAVLARNPEKTLVYNSKREGLLDFAHLWAVLGHAMGLEDDFNIALPHTQYPRQFQVERMQSYLSEIKSTYFIPMLFNLQKENTILMEAFMQATSDILGNPEFLTDPEFLLRGILRDVVGIPIPNLEARRRFSPVSSYSLDWLVQVASRLPNILFSNWDKIFAPFAALTHFQIGFKYFGLLYSSDESIAKYCFVT